MNNLWYYFFLSKNDKGDSVCMQCWGRSLCSEKSAVHTAVLEGKCKTNMPHTCFHLSCHGSAFTDSPPHCLTQTPVSHCLGVHWSKAAVTLPSNPPQWPGQEGFLINTDPCAGHFLRDCVSAAQTVRHYCFPTVLHRQHTTHWHLEQELRLTLWTPTCFVTSSCFLLRPQSDCFKSHSLN